MIAVMSKLPASHDERIAARIGESHDAPSWGQTYQTNQPEVGGPTLWTPCVTESVLNEKCRNPQFCIVARAIHAFIIARELRRLDMASKSSSASLISPP